MKILILTSGGDAPGMNACIESLVKGINLKGLQSYVVKHGLKGLYDNTIRKIDEREVEGISKLGGSIIGSSRFPDFSLDEIREQCAENLKGFDYLVVIGGEGSLHAAKILNEYIKTIFIPATIDGNLAESIGYDTALNTVVEAIERIQDSARSHDRHFIVEVMGNKSGKLAYGAFLANAGDIALIGEHQVNAEHLLDVLNREHSVMIFSENLGKVDDFVEEIYAQTGKKIYPVKLGHTQRGGAPSARDRVNATIYAIEAVKCILKHQTGALLKFKLISFADSEVIHVDKEIYAEMLDMRCKK